ncbi:DNA mismatch repair protein MutS [Isachenkonia alkalipeptolytica]|uniref:DNA mismatch repair protein MutS n=1 Tax=Isachenkonia alkalipeptolytica TaxID=2565777 RepID=A0AA43XM28_9CLOT|nr:DNA mismatch repair protein MutS [Isachenkonia alkalipeptolytica]NBG88749.1 DNA mismatch repair protein MutS [Isachenkonia alkalipeptolytica]
MKKLTPMMKQYLDLKEQYPDSLLFFRLGDFYELFFEDAITAARELEITLTARDCGQEEKAAMCGVPYHSVSNYLDRLVEKGYKIAICEQMEDPSEAKGIVKRDVVRVITPGTLIDTNLLEEKENNYLLALYSNQEGFGLSYTDISTGEFYTTHYPGKDNITLQSIKDELGKIAPKEIIYSFYGKESYGKNLLEYMRTLNIHAETIDEWNLDLNGVEKRLKTHFQVENIESLGLIDNPLETMASGILIDYLQRTQKRSLKHINHIDFYGHRDTMLLDANTRRNLELTHSMQHKGKKGSLLWVLDKTVTAMGGRMLRKWIEEPLIDHKTITKRLNTVDYFKEALLSREELVEALKHIYDLERLTSKIGYDSANPRDLISLKNSITYLPVIKEILIQSQDQLLLELLEDLDLLENIKELIESSILEEPSVGLKDGKIIKASYDPQVKELRELASDGHHWMTRLEEQEKQRTGIKSLKVKYNKIFGYFIDVTRSNLDLVPEDYIRKQTLANSERYITPELKEMESKILGAEEKIIALEHQLFLQVREQIKKHTHRIQKTAKVVAGIDVLNAFAQVAYENDYHKPEISVGDKIHIAEGRHPVVEKMLVEENFIPNDTFLNNKDEAISIITGPNMAGKSTYMRQVALISLMTQIGSFVPAKNASISIVDRIFTRVGASDDLSQGKSTFMVEMTEMAHILNNATEKSLLILDEIGRGTSTFDGLSIAWAIVEEISKNLKAKTLFSTHYHELTALGSNLTNVQNYQFTVKEEGDDIIFLRKVLKGNADKSYGIQVAKLAGLPVKVINNANGILHSLENNKKKPKVLEDQVQISKEKVQDGLSIREQREETHQVAKGRNPEQKQLDFHAYYERQLIDEVKSVNLVETTPLDALNYLYNLQSQLKNMTEENQHGKKSKNAR